ncbi:MAG: hypothetical protein WAS73_15340 [Defluviicoccus sp.]
MNPDSTLALRRISQYGVGGAFVGMVLVGTILWWDVSAIGSMLSAAGETVRLNLFLAGAMMKGALIGAVVGAALPMRQRSTARATASTPIAYEAGA